MTRTLGAWNTGLHKKRLDKLSAKLTLTSLADELSNWNDPASVLGELNSRRLVAGRWDIRNQLNVSAAVQGPLYPEQGLVQYGFKKAGKIALLGTVLLAPPPTVLIDS